MKRNYSAPDAAATLLFILTAGVVSVTLPALADPSATVSAETSPDASSVPDLEGVWLQKMVLPGNSTLPVLPDVETKTVSLLRSTVRQDGSDLSINMDLCRMDIENSYGPVSIDFPSRLIDSMPEQQRRGSLDPSEGVIRFSIAREVTTVGAELESAEARLPTEPEDERVVDTDGDGHPGVTVLVNGPVSGQLYAVQRSEDRFRGTVENRNLITGTVYWSTEQRVLGSTHWLLGDGPDTEPKPGTFKMVRIDKSLSCSDIRRRSDQFLKSSG